MVFPTTHNDYIRLTAAALAFVATMLMATSASAFLFTEDADAGDIGELESETFAEIFPADRATLLNQEFNLGIANGVEMGVFSGIGYDFDAGEFAVANPGAQLKALLHESKEKSAMPSLAIMAGGLIPAATGVGELPAPAAFALVPVTFEVGPAAVHAHGGWAFSDDADFEHRPLVGVAAEVGVSDELDLLVEAVNADPVEPTGPPLAFQAGFNLGVADAMEVWLLGALASDTTSDQTLFDDIEVGAQLGLRIETRLFGEQ